MHALCRTSLYLLVAYILFLGKAYPAESETDVWFKPAAESPDYVQLFDRPDLWSNALSRVRVFQFGPRQLPVFSDRNNEMYRTLIAHDAFRKVVQHHVLIAVGAASVKEWDCTATRPKGPGRGEGAEQVTLDYLRDIFNGGASATYVAIDEPLVSGLGACHETLAQVAENTARYAREIYANPDAKLWAPNLAIGDVEPYPSQPVNRLEQWTKELIARGFKPAFFQIDIDLGDVNARRRLDFSGDLKELRAFFSQQSIPFGVIFWSGRGSEPSDRSYYEHTMELVNRIHASIGRPDESIFDSWIFRSSIQCTGDEICRPFNAFRCAPSDPPYCGKQSVPLNLPESGDTYSHTRLINDAMSILNGQ